MKYILYGIAYMILIKMFDFITITTWYTEIIIYVQGLILIPYIVLAIKKGQKELFKYSLGNLIVCLLVMFTEYNFSFPSILSSYKPNGMFGGLHTLGYSMVMLYDFVLVILIYVLIAIIKLIITKIKKNNNE